MDVSGKNICVIDFVQMKTYLIKLSWSVGIFVWTPAFFLPTKLIMVSELKKQTEQGCAIVTFSQHSLSVSHKTQIRQ